MPNSHDTLEETIHHLNGLKLNSYPVGKIEDLCDVILVSAECLENYMAFNPKRLGYITILFEDTYDSRFLLWVIHNYKEVADFINKLFLCDLYVIQPEDIITYEYLVQEDTHEYCDCVDSK